MCAVGILKHRSKHSLDFVVAWTAKLVLSTTTKTHWVPQCFMLTIANMAMQQALPVPCQPTNQPTNEVAH